MKHFIDGVTHRPTSFLSAYTHRLTSYREKPIIYKPCYFVILLMQRAVL